MVKLHDKYFKPYISAEKINEAVYKMAALI
ncbi:MAG TPA: hypoxanthine phosphoribosyltransferase, partial [Flavobacteriaceae bacterium]|nr:hypoxanthine phosphoribosyltransferase [Flavobacteriaceae bacterium]